MVKKLPKSVVEISHYNDYQRSIVELNQKEKKRKKVSLTNKSSIAFFVWVWKISKNIYFLGDSDADDIVGTLTELGYSKK